MNSPTNKDRARWALKTIKAFTNTVGDAGDLETNMGDLIADLHHLADQKRIPWERVLDVAYGHYNAETEGGGK